MLSKNENRFTIRTKAMTAFLKLTPTEENLLKEAEQAIVTKKNRKALVKNLIADYKQIGLVYKFYEKSPIFKQFCDNNEFGHLTKWNNVVKLLGYPHDTLVSFDKNRKIEIVDQYFGAYFISEYVGFKKGEKDISPEVAKLCLDLACEKGNFKALILRCDENSNQIKKALSKKQDPVDALTQVWSDSKELANLYWTVGMLDASLILLDVGNYMANKNDPSLERQAQLFQKQAAQLFLQAKELAKYKERKTKDLFLGNKPAEAAEDNSIEKELSKDLAYDENMIKKIYGTKGLGVFEFSSWNNAEDYFLNHVDNQIDSHQELKLNAMQFINKNLKNDSRERRIYKSS